MDVRFSIFSQTLREVRPSLVKWTLILAGTTWILFLVYPLFDWLSGGRLFNHPLPGWAVVLLAGSPVGAYRIGSLGGWIMQVGMGLILPVLLVFQAARRASSLIAGEEERGSLGLLLATPVSRQRLIFEMFAVLVLLVFAPAAAVTVSLLLAAWTGLLALAAGQILAAGLNLFLLGMAFGALALTLGCLTGRRVLSQTLVLGFALISLVVSRLSFTPFHLIFPFYYYHLSVQRSALSLPTLALAGWAAAGYGLAWTFFERRDLAV